MQGPEHVAQARCGAPRSEPRLRDRACQGVAGASPENAAGRRALRKRECGRGGGHGCSGGGGAAATRRETPQAEGAVAVVARRGRPGPRPPLASLLPALRRGALRQVPERDSRLDGAEGSTPRAGRPLDLAGLDRLRSARVDQGRRRGPSPAPGEALGASVAHAGSGPEGFRDTLAHGGYAGERTETLRTVAGEAQGQPFRPRQALPGDEEGSINPCGQRSLQQTVANVHRATPPRLKRKLRRLMRN